MNVLYTGDASPMKVKVGALIIDGWKKGETRDIPDSHVDRMLKQTYFSLASGEEKIEVKIEEDKPEEKEKFNVDEASKDELLDFTAEKDIDADYTMTKNELKGLIKEYLNK